jgi:gluconate 2-dehydrogenase gamma chain
MTDEKRPVDASVVNRRQFVQRSGVLVASATVGMSVTASQASALQESEATPTGAEYPDVPLAPETPPDADTFQALTQEEAAVVEALTARLLPGTPDDPGAREAGVVTYIDNMLAYEGGLVEKLYLKGPWAESYEGEQPSPQDGVVWVDAEEIERYGFQSRLTPLEVYQQGIAAINRYVDGQYGQPVAELSEEEQDDIIQALLDNEIDEFQDVPFEPESFFHALRRHTMEGMFSDPAYGGNRDMVGWRLIGYPGAQRAYLPTDIITEGTNREPQPLAELTHFHPGRGIDAREERGPVLPVAGSEEDE